MSTARLVVFLSKGTCALNAGLTGHRNRYEQLSKKAVIKILITISLLLSFFVKKKDIFIDKFYGSDLYKKWFVAGKTQRNTHRLIIELSEKMVC